MTFILTAAESLTDEIDSIIAEICPDAILEGNGKYRRHIKLTRQSDIDDKSVRSFIEQAFS